MTDALSAPALASDLAHTRARLAEAEELLHAIRHGEVDAVLVTGDGGAQVYTLSGADRIYRQIIESMSEGAAVLSDAGGIYHANRAFARLLRTPLDRLIGTELGAFTSQVDRPVLARCLAAALRGDSRAEVTLEAADGSLVPVQLGLSRLQVELETFVCVVATDLTKARKHEAEMMLLHDDLERQVSDLATSRLVAVTMVGELVQARDALAATNRALEREAAERERTEAALRDSERFAGSIIDALLVHLCVLDEAGTLLATNQAWQTFTAANPPLPTNAGVGASYLAVCDAVTGPDRAAAGAFAAGARRVIAGEQDAFEMEYTCHSPDQQRWFLARVTRFAGAVPVRVVVTHENITHRVQAAAEHARLEARLRQQQKLDSIGTLASGVAHEINNPINGVLNYAQLILDMLPVDSPLAEYASEILLETDRVAIIVRNLLKFARDDQQTHSPERVLDIVEATLSLTRAVLRHDQVTLAIDVPDDLPELMCRSQQVQQVLLNLLTNARDAVNERYPGHDDDKVISLTCRAFDDLGQPWLRMTVEDHGTGITDEVASRMLDPFFTTKPRDVGTGLGLYISHGIVHEHQGRLWHETEAGHWTKFHVDLPAGNGAAS